MEMSVQRINNPQPPSYFECSEKNFIRVYSLPEKLRYYTRNILVEIFTYIMETRQNASIKFDTNHNDVITFKYQ